LPVMPGEPSFDRQSESSEGGDHGGAEMVSSSRRRLEPNQLTLNRPPYNNLMGGNDEIEPVPPLIQ